MEPTLRIAHVAMLRLLTRRQAAAPDGFVEGLIAGLADGRRPLWPADAQRRWWEENRREVQATLRQNPGFNYYRIVAYGFRGGGPDAAEMGEVRRRYGDQGLVADIRSLSDDSPGQLRGTPGLWRCRTLVDLWDPAALEEESAWFRSLFAACAPLPRDRDQDPWLRLLAEFRESAAALGPRPAGAMALAADGYEESGMRDRARRVRAAIACGPGRWRPSP